MCARFTFGKSYKPGEPIQIVDASGELKAVWAGFAQVEKIDWWKRQGLTEVDIPATEFAERSERTGKLVWGKVPEGMVIRGLLMREDAIVKVVTRGANKEELAHYEHPRMPETTAAMHPKSLEIEPPKISSSRQDELSLF